MELRDLRYFLACVDEGNVTRAGERVHAAQPTLSHAIRRLETEAGTRLLERRPRHRVRPTPAGEMLAARARRTLEAIRGFADDLASLKGLVSGTLRVAAIQSLAVTLLPPALARYAQAFPGVDIDAHVGPADEILAALRDGRADVGLIAGRPPLLPKLITAERLYREPFVAVVRASDPLARRSQVPIAGLRDCPFVLVRASSPTGTIIHAACAAAGLVPRVRLTVDSGEALLELVRAGVGITILPARYLHRPQKDLRAVRLVSPTPWREVFALGPAGEPSAAAAAFLDLLRKRPRATPPGRTSTRAASPAATATFPRARRSARGAT